MSEASAEHELPVVTAAAPAMMMTTADDAPAPAPTAAPDGPRTQTEADTTTTGISDDRRRSSSSVSASSTPASVEPSSCPPSPSPPPSPRSRRRPPSPLKGSAGPALRVLVCSWNVGNAQPPKDPALLHEWVPRGGGGFDVVAIGLQESAYRERSGSDAESSPARSPRTGRASSSRAGVSENDDEGYDDGPLDVDMDAGETEAETVAPGPPESVAAHDVDVDVDVHVEEAEEEEGEDEEADEVGGSGELAVVRASGSRTSRSFRKVTKAVRHLSSNLRGSVNEALDYPFNRQLCAQLGDDYGLAAKVELLEMRLFVYVHTRHPVTAVEKLSVATGLGSVLGNKGGLILKLVIRNTSLCFVSCHLAAHQDQKFLDKRNSDCATILGAGIGRKRIQLDHQFDHCFWFGDLNYRVDLSYTAPRDRSHEQHFGEVLALIRQRKWALLNANDQLRHQLEQRRALVGWELPPALFPPTFKRVRHALDQYNPQRVPSYCDRVLHKSLPGLRGHLKLERFECVERIATSDHKPVRAAFRVQPTPRLALKEGGSVLSRTTTIELRELVAKDLLGMDVSGLSDPYVKFYSLPEHVLTREANGSHPATAKIMHTLAPAWQDDQVPRLTLRCDSERDARSVHLVLLFMDYDATSKDDVMGVAVLALDRFCAPATTRARFVPFEAPLVHQGRPAGSVSGRLRVLLPHQEPAADGAIDAVTTASKEIALRVAGCHCSIS